MTEHGVGQLLEANREVLRANRGHLENMVQMAETEIKTSASGKGTSSLSMMKPQLEMLLRENYGERLARVFKETVKEMIMEVVFLSAWLWILVGFPNSREGWVVCAGGLDSLVDTVGKY